MYPCPAEIQVVREPLPTLPLPSQTQGAANKPTAAAILPTIAWRAPLSILTWPAPPQPNRPQAPVGYYIDGGGTLHSWGYRNSTTADVWRRGERGGGTGLPAGTAGGISGFGGWQYDSNGNFAQHHADFDSLIDLMTSSVHPTTWTDGRWLLSGTTGNEIRLWNAPSGTGQPVQLRVLPTPGGTNLDPLAVRTYPVADLVIPIREQGGGQGMIGQVQVELLEGLDVLILRGHERDTRQVMDIIQQIERLGARPEIEPVTVGLAAPGVFMADLDIPFDANGDDWSTERLQFGQRLDLRIARQMGAVDVLYQVERSHIPTPDEPPLTYPDAEVWKELTGRRKKHYSAMELSKRGKAEQKIEEALRSETNLDFVETPLSDVIDYLKDYHHIEIQINRKVLDDVGIASDTPITRKLKGVSLRSALRLMLRDLNLTYVIDDGVLLITTPEEDSLKERDLAGWLQGRRFAQPPTYQQPTFKNQWDVYYNLLAYAPGMQTGLSDVWAVLEAEAQPGATVPTGSIDKKARRLVEKARGAGWQTADIMDKDGKVLLSVDFDGTGRYRYVRTTAAGLREEILCDGAKLWHLYGELGVGARRDVSRFHRAQFARLIPWALPPVEELARGCDLTAVDKRTVAVTAAGIKEQKDADGKPVRYASVYLLFGSDGRLAERRLVEMPGGKVLLRQMFAADGAVKILGSDKKVLAEWRIVLRPCGAPQLQPDTEKLVILPLPARTRDHVQRTRSQPPGNFAAWSEEDALAYLASDLAQGSDEAAQVISQRFLQRGDRRLGFYTLLLSSAYVWNPQQEHDFGNNLRLRLDPLSDHPHELLAQYVAGYLKARQSNHQEPIGPVDSREPAGFLPQLAEFHDLYARWSSGKAAQSDAAHLALDRERALQFLRNCRLPELQWALLSVIRAQRGDAEFCGLIEQMDLSTKNFPAVSYVARYEHARGLGQSGNWPRAEELFSKLYSETLEAGWLPPIDAGFRQAFQNAAGGPQRWQALVRETAAKLLAEGLRPLVVRLAWQVQQAGDQPLADEVLNLALGGAESAEGLPATLAAVEYLWSTNQLPRADGLLQPLLDDPKYSQWPALWRLAAMLAEQRGMTARSLSYTERAMQLEYKGLPEVFNVQAVRNEYSQLLTKYQQLAAAVAVPGAAPPRELVAQVIRAADRWRAIDPDPTAACQAAARILADLGAADLAWDYLTTPLAAKPNEAAPWASLAETLRQQGQFELSDRAYASAFEAEPTNAQLLWDRAQVLLQAGRGAEAKRLLRQLAGGQWQPRFQGLQLQAKQSLEVY